MTVTAEFIAAKRYVLFILRDFDYEKKELNVSRMKQLKSLVKNHPDLITPLVGHLFKFIRQENSDRRLAILLICDCFFHRSHLFRVQIINQLEDFLLYTAETDPLHYSLPGPQEAAKSLKLETLKMIKIWNEKFSSAYPKLDHAYNCLRYSKAFDLERVDAQLQIERERATEAESRRESVANRVIQTVIQQMNDRGDDINGCINETRNALELLVPRFINENLTDLPKDSSSMEEGGIEHKAEHGYVDIANVSVIIPSSSITIKKDESNDAIIHSLCDSVKLLLFYSKQISKWIQKLTKFGGRNEEKQIKEAVELKARVDLEIERCDELKLKEVKKRLNGSDSESDDFEDVPEKEGLELDFKEPDDVPSHLLERIKQLEDPNQPGPSGLVPKRIQSTTVKEDSSAKSHIPTLSYGLDLKYWGEKDVKPAEIPKNNADCHRFWRPADDGETQQDAGDEVYHTRLMLFVGKDQRSSKECRAPLRDGSLCKRMDIKKCPIHGIIVDRDHMGYPKEQMEISSPEKNQEKIEDEEYMRDIEAATGVNLRQESKGKHRKFMRKREVAPGKKLRQRLEKKLLDPKTVNRVSSTLDMIRKERAARNFEHQFNYALSKR